MPLVFDPVEYQKENGIAVIRAQGDGSTTVKIVDDNGNVLDEQTIAAAISAKMFEMNRAEDTRLANLAVQQAKQAAIDAVISSLTQFNVAKTIDANGNIVDAS